MTSLALTIPTTRPFRTMGTRRTIRSSITAATFWTGVSSDAETGFGACGVDAEGRYRGEPVQRVRALHPLMEPVVLPEPVESSQLTVDGRVPVRFYGRLGGMMPTAPEVLAVSDEAIGSPIVSDPQVAIVMNLHGEDATDRLWYASRGKYGASDGGSGREG
jgi:hypothetical protein